VTRKPAVYANHGHYIAEGWSTEPKESFKALADLLEARGVGPGAALLDVGCATGELLAHLATRFEGARLVGVDVADELVATARRLLPEAEFAQASALDLPAEHTGAFDTVTAMGCMSIFDEAEVETFWDNLFRAAKPGGLIVVFSPLNEHGVDAVIRHRKRLGGKAGPWEAGWNVFSTDTVAELVAARGGTLEFERFELPFDLAPREDPVRTWTLRTERRERQLTNGLKLLIDHYFTIVRTSGRTA